MIYFIKKNFQIFYIVVLLYTNIQMYQIILVRMLTISVYTFIREICFYTSWVNDMPQRWVQTVDLINISFFPTSSEPVNFSLVLSRWSQFSFIKFKCKL